MKQADSDNLELMFKRPIDRQPPETRRLMIRSALAIFALVAVAVVAVVWSLGVRENQVLTEARTRTELLASTRATVLGNWLKGLGSGGERLARSDLFRLFAAEANQSGPIAAGDPSLAAQIPYMVQALTDLVRQEQYAGAYVVARDGRAVLASGGAPELSDAQRAAAVKVFDGHTRAVSPARLSTHDLVIDVLLPIAQPQEPNPATPKDVVGVLLVTVPVGASLRDLLAPLPLMGPTEHSHLLQVGGATSELDPFHQPTIRPVGGFAKPAADAPLPFGLRTAIGGGSRVFSIGTWISGTPWLVVQEDEAAAVLAPFRSFQWTVIGFAALLTLALAVGFGALWWRQASENAQAMAVQFRNLAGRINNQRQFLDSLMGTLQELIGLKKTDGVYTYVNPAFAQSVGRSNEQVPGLDDAALFGQGTAEKLQKTDKLAVQADRPVIVDEAIYLPKGLRYFQFSKVPYRDENGETIGILSVARDITDLRLAEERRQHAIQKMTEALVRTIEQVDPFLAGHTHNVEAFSSLLTHRLALNAEQTMTVKIAANLAQIGKIAIPRDIVAKTGRLTHEENRIMQTHVDHALAILEDIDFGLPVLETIARSYERLDGSGYPLGLKGDAIRLEARILGICDVFCARLEPRSYRKPIAAEEALRVLEEHGEKYDTRIVEELRKLVQAVEGEKLVTAMHAG